MANKLNSRNHKHLGPTTRTPRRRRAGQGAPRIKDLGRSDLARDYEQGPFPAARVPDFPAELVALFERITGRRFDADTMAAYERVRAFLAYPGIPMTGRLLAGVRLEGDEDFGAPVQPTPPVDDQLTATPRKIRTPYTGATAGGINPHDLGDD